VTIHNEANYIRGGHFKSSFWATTRPHTFLYCRKREFCHL